MIDWYDKKGKPLTTARKVGSKLWLKEMIKVGKLLKNRKYKVIKQERLWWGGWLSTVWLGLDHDLGYAAITGKKHKPVIFETMLFLGSLSEIDMNRYHTEEEAVAGHEAMKKLYSKPKMIAKAYWRRVDRRLWDLKYKIKSSFKKLWKR